MRIGRVVGVTALLAALGGLAGALGGTLIALGLLLLTEGSPSFGILMAVLRTAAFVGFCVGGLAGPVLAWTLLRQAPIWRAIGETALAAGLTAALSLAADLSHTLEIGFWPMIGWSVVGASLAALRLRVASRSQPRVALPDEQR